MRGERLLDGCVGAFGKDLPRAAHAPGSVDLKVEFHISWEEEEQNDADGVRVGNRTDGVATASGFIRTDVREGKGKKEHVPDSLKGPQIWIWHR